MRWLCASVDEIESNFLENVAVEAHYRFSPSPAS